LAEVPLVATRTFIQATRDAGYRSPAQAVAELVDNSIQAGAARVDIDVEAGPGGPQISVWDDGSGMDEDALAAALQFGGSSRFDDRGGMGRFGMGLPNSSLSQARRLEVYSWRGGAPIAAHIDVDEIVEGKASGLVPPEERPLPDGREPGADSGTLVVWRRCDRLADRRLPALRGELRDALGSMFRHFIWDGLELSISGERCEGVDPLLLHPKSPWRGASPFGEPVQLELRAPQGQERGLVTVRFSELPVHAWHDLTHAAKKRMGVTRGGGAYVVRARREIDRGWFFMGEKRKENYDDWWRVEIAFDPELDEAFGITNTKQHIRPTQWLIDALTPEIEGVARALNTRVRRAHETLKTRERFAVSEAAASKVESRMPPLEYPSRPQTSPLTERLTSLFPDVLQAPESPDVRIVEDDLGDAGLFEIVLASKRLVVVLNTAHPYYRRAYAPLAESTDPAAVERRASLELLLVSLARADAASDDREGARARHVAWAQTLAELVRT
jgi:hypothetical protein